MMSPVNPTDVGATHVRMNDLGVGVWLKGGKDTIASSFLPALPLTLPIPPSLPSHFHPLDGVQWPFDRDGVGSSGARVRWSCVGGVTYVDGAQGVFV